MHQSQYRDFSTSSIPYLRVMELATGGMGKVEVALRRGGTFRRLYAVKRLHEHLQRDTSFRKMFLNEGRIAGLIQHPNVVSVVDVGEDRNGPYLVMDYVEGLPMGEVIRLSIERGDPMPTQVVARIGKEIARGLHAAHELKGHEGQALNLVHRDLSPPNVLIGFDGTVRITDFGIAKAIGQQIRTSTGVLKGKISYMSPEQLQFQEPDRRSDLFAIGVILYEALAGRQLYPNKEGMEAARRILSEPPPDIGEERPDVPAAFVELLFDLLVKDRTLRPSTAAEVADRLEGVCAELVQEEGNIPLRGFFQEFLQEERELHQKVLHNSIRAATTVKTPTFDEREPTVQTVRRMQTTSEKKFVLGLTVSLVIAIIIGLGFLWGRISALQERPASGTSTTIE